MIQIVDQFFVKFNIRRSIAMKIFTVNILTIFFLTGCNTDDNSNHHLNLQPVKLAAVAYENISLPIHSSGILSSSVEIRLSFKTGGIVDRIYANEGRLVKKGDLLAKLKLEEIRAKVIQAQNAVDKAKRDFKRINNLFADSVATLEQKQNAQTALNVANANLKIASFNFAHSKIVAPADGKILKKFIEENELVAPGIPVFYFGSIGENWIVHTGLTDREIIRIQFGDSANVFFDSYPYSIFHGTVSEISESMDPMTGTYEVELEINQGNFKLMSGFMATVDIYPTYKQKKLLIPIEALVEADKDKGYVYAFIQSDSTVKKLPVTIERIYKEKVIIKSGLKSIKEIITAGSEYLEDGMKVKVVK